MQDLAVNIPLKTERILSGLPPLHPKRILVYVGKDLLGDALIKLPFLRRLRALYPTSDIVWFAGQGKSVLSSFLAPLIKGLDIEVWDDFSYGKSWLDGLSPHKRLLSPSFDLIIDTQKHLKTTLLLNRLPHEHFISGTMGFYFSDRSPPKSPRRRVSLPEEFDRLLLACSPMVHSGPLKALEVPKEAMELAENLLPGSQAYVGLVPGGGGRHKCWPLDRYIALAQWLHENDHKPIFILGPQEEEWTARIQKELPWVQCPLQDPRTLDQGGPTLFQTMAIGTRLDFAVTNDCGTAHLLAVVDTPLISLFGPTNAVKFRPSSKIVHILEASTWGTKAMSSIPLSGVQDAVLQFQRQIQAFGSG